MKLHVLFLAFVCLFLSACRQESVPVVDHPRLAEGTKLQNVSFQSHALNRPTFYRVIMPVETDPGERLPVVILLHGKGENRLAWSNFSEVAAYAAKGMVLVMPEGGDSYFVNAAHGSDEKYQDYITSDLIADVEARFPVRKERAGRAVVGDSMGGYAAIEYALARPDLFAFAGALSPAVDVPGRKFSWKRWMQSLEYRHIFGGAGSPERQALDPFVQVRTASAQNAPYIYITAGQGEPMEKSIRHFAGQLHQYHFAYEFHSKPGGHDWSEWNEQLPGCFEKLMATVNPQKN